MVTEQNALDYMLEVKNAFVENHLAPMLRTVVGKIKSVEYAAVVSADGLNTTMETVTVEFKNGGVKRVNVTGNSCLQIAKDVLSKFN